MMIRKAQEKDIPRILDLLHQVLDIHAKGRPDLFVAGSTKYDENELKEILKDESIVIFVYEEEIVQGYLFGMIQDSSNTQNLVPLKTFFIDDLCVDQSQRGNHIGLSLYNHAKEFAKEIGCYHITLNVWNCNPDAMAFYKKIGLTPMKEVLEEIL